MGKTIRFDAKYPNELAKNSKQMKNSGEKTKELDNTHKKEHKQSKKGKRFLKDNHLQRVWPFVDEKKKGHKV